jgi:26S proteasome regulatory subunit N1
MLTLSSTVNLDQESDTSLYMPALESLRTLIKTSTSSMTAVPKPLKFLRPFYEELISTFEGFDESKLENERVSAENLQAILISCI